MEVKFRQTTRNGCGSLSIANIFDDHRFTLGLEDCPGERYADLNKKLQDLGCPIFVDPLFLTSQYFRTANRLGQGQVEIFKYSKKSMTDRIQESNVVPYVISLANSPGRNQHMVALIHSIGDDMFYVIDSAKTKIAAYTWLELLQRFHIVSVAVFRMWDHPEPGNFITLDKAELPHIFP